MKARVILVIELDVPKVDDRTVAEALWKYLKELTTLGEEFAEGKLIQMTNEEVQP